jgi:hypothetical protein
MRHPCYLPPGTDASLCLRRAPLYCGSRQKPQEDVAVVVLSDPAHGAPGFGPGPRPSAVAVIGQGAKAGMNLTFPAQGIVAGWGRYCDPRLDGTDACTFGDAESAVGVGPRTEAGSRSEKRFCADALPFVDDGPCLSGAQFAAAAAALGTIVLCGCAACCRRRAGRTDAPGEVSSAREGRGAGRAEGRNGGREAELPPAELPPGQAPKRLPGRRGSRANLERIERVFMEGCRGSVDARAAGIALEVVEDTGNDTPRGGW